jgi:hypothetical protein
VRRIDRLVALWIVERLGDIRREGRLSGRLALEPQAPAAFAERLQELDRAEPLTCTQLPRRPSQALPLVVAIQALEEQHLGLSPALAPQTQACRHDAGVVDDDELVS